MHFNNEYNIMRHHPLEESILNYMQWIELELVNFKAETYCYLQKQYVPCSMLTLNKAAKMFPTTTAACFQAPEN